MTSDDHSHAEHQAPFSALITTGPCSRERTLHIRRASGCCHGAFFLGVTVAMNCFNHSPGSRNVGFSHKSCWEPEKHELDGCSCGNVVVLPNKKRRLSWKLQIQRFDANSMQSQC